MATLQKFKLLATQCAAAGSPTRSPTTSPVVHIRRRKTLRMLLSRGGGDGRRRHPTRCDGSSPDRSTEKGRELSVRHKLKDLFVSSPPAFGKGDEDSAREGLLPPIGGGSGSGGGGGRVRRIGGRSMRPLTASFRQRLLRRAWRPVLVAIPE